MSLFFETFKIFTTTAVIAYLLCKIMKTSILPKHDHNFFQKMVYTTINVLIMCSLPDILIYTNMMSFSMTPDYIPSKVFIYVISFDAIYAIVHFSQHKWFEWSHIENHDMKNILYSGHAFVYGPLDSLLLQLCVYSPFYFNLKFTRQTWSLAMFFIILCGFVNHSERPFIETRLKHYQRKHEGHYSFTGIPENIINKLK